MEVISALHIQLQQASSELERILKAVNEQQVQITEFEMKTKQKEKDIDDTSRALEHFKNVLVDESNRLESLMSHYKILESQLESIEVNTSSLPLFLDRLCSEFLSSSSTIKSSLDQCCSKAMHNDYWYEKTNKILLDIENTRQSVKAKLAQRQKEFKEIERDLDRQFEEEQNAYNIDLTCIDAYENKNRMLRQRANTPFSSSASSVLDSTKPSFQSHNRLPSHQAPPYHAAFAPPRPTPPTRGAPPERNSSEEAGHAYAYGNSYAYTNTSFPGGMGRQSPVSGSGSASRPANATGQVPVTGSTRGGAAHHDCEVRAEPDQGLPPGGMSSYSHPHTYMPAHGGAYVAHFSYSTTVTEERIFDYNCADSGSGSGDEVADDEPAAAQDTQPRPSRVSAAKDPAPAAKYEYGTDSTIPWFHQLKKRRPTSAPHTQSQTQTHSQAHAHPHSQTHTHASRMAEEASAPSQDGDSSRHAQNQAHTSSPWNGATNQSSAQPAIRATFQSGLYLLHEQTSRKRLSELD